MTELAFTTEDCGTFADGTFGHGHIRNRLADLVRAVDGGLGNSEFLEIEASLAGPMPDDCWDEDRAIELLEDVSSGDVAWCLDGGDLLLVEVTGSEDFADF
jgi:hypothetical protein